ncbi:MAG: glycosyltransferase family 4 protein [Thermoleophilia bacterium]
MSDAKSVLERAGDRRERMLIQVGPAHGSGGIADIMRIIDDWAKSSCRPIRTVSTSCDGSSTKRLLVGIVGISRALALMIASPHALVHVHSSSNGSFLRKSVILLAAGALRRPTVLQIHSGAFDSFVMAGSRGRRRFVAFVLRQADVVVVTNVATQRFIRDLQPLVPAVVVPNPATMVCGAQTDSSSRQVLFLGRLGRTKGTDVLLEAVRGLQVANVDAEFVLAGDGSDENVHAAIAKFPAPSRVHLLGWVDRQRVHQLLHESSILCQPSRSEGLPMALLQAMGHGLACIVTPVGGMADIIRDGVNGLIVPTNDPHALTEALRKLLDDPALRRTLGHAAYACIQADFLPDTVMRRLDEIYATVPAHQTHVGRR